MKFIFSFGWSWTIWLTWIICFKIRSHGNVPSPKIKIGLRQQNWTFINPLVYSVTFLSPLKTSENLTVFWCYEGVEKGFIGSNWVNLVITGGFVSAFQRRIQDFLKHLWWSFLSYMFDWVINTALRFDRNHLIQKVLIKKGVT